MWPFGRKKREARRAAARAVMSAAAASIKTLLRPDLQIKYDQQAVYQANAGLIACLQQVLENQKAQAEAINKLLGDNAALMLGVASIAKVQEAEIYYLRRLVFKPEIRGIHYVGERTAMSKHFMQFQATFNAVEPGADVDHRELTISVEGSDPSTATLAKDAVQSDSLEAEVGKAVELSLVDVDASGHRSGADVLSFTVSDTLPPATPSGLGVAYTGERTED